VNVRSQPENEGHLITYELSLLTQLVKLGVAIKQPGANELVENAHYQRRQHGEKDVVEGQCPGLIDDLSRKRVLK
jgi:hypothetical protein